MSDKKSKGGTVTLRKAPANDNDPGVTYTDKTHGDQPNGERNVMKRRYGRVTVSFRDWPDGLPVLTEELALIETYLPELIGAIIANDNDG